MKAINLGFRSMTMDPSSQMRQLQRRIERRNAAVEAWNQTAQALQASTKQVKANFTR